jgi:hypothetical protein
MREVTTELSSRALRIWAQFAASLMLITGIVGVLIVIVDHYIHLEFLKDPARIVLIVFSAQAAAMGIERLTAFEEARRDRDRAHQEAMERFQQLQEQIVGTDRDVGDIQRTLLTAISGRMLIDERVVYQEAKRLIEESDDNDIIRATSLTPGEERSGSATMDVEDRYLEGPIASRIKRAKERGGSMTYRDIILLRKEDISKLDQEDAEPLVSYARERICTRQQIITEAGVSDRLWLRHIGTSWPLDMLIVGDSMIIGFATLRRRTTMFMGIRITDSVFVPLVSQWYDDSLWQAAEDIPWICPSTASADSQQAMVNAGVSGQGRVADSPAAPLTGGPLPQPRTKPRRQR